MGEVRNVAATLGTKNECSADAPGPSARQVCGIASFFFQDLSMTHPAAALPS